MDFVFGFQCLTYGRSLMALGLDGSFGSSQSLGSDPALDPTRGHLISLDSSNSQSHSSHQKRKKEGIRAGERKGGRKKGEKQERRKGFR